MLGLTRSLGVSGVALSLLVGGVTGYLASNAGPRLFTVEARDALVIQDGPGAPGRNQRCRSRQAAECPRAGQANTPPEVKLDASDKKITLPCAGAEAPGGQRVLLQASATDADGDSLRYAYSVTGGSVTGEGAEATWELAGVRSGTYTATVEVDDTCGCVAFASTLVKVEACEGPTD